MGGLKKTARKIGKVGGKLIGTAIGFMAGGPLGAAAGYKVGDMAGDAIVKTNDKVLGGPPQPAEPMQTALPDEEEIKRAKRRALASRAGRTGRESTILTGNDQPLG